MSVKFKQEVYDQFEVIRSRGCCNMFDWRCVVGMANLLGFYDLAVLDRMEYFALLKDIGKKFIVQMEKI